MEYLIRYGTGKDLLVRIAAQIRASSRLVGEYLAVSTNPKPKRKKSLLNRIFSTSRTSSEDEEFDLRPDVQKALTGAAIAWKESAVAAAEKLTEQGIVEDAKRVKRCALLAGQAARAKGPRDARIPFKLFSVSLELQD